MFSILCFYNTAGKPQALPATKCTRVHCTTSCQTGAKCTRAVKSTATQSMQHKVYYYKPHTRYLARNTTHKPSTISGLDQKCPVSKALENSAMFTRHHKQQGNPNLVKLGGHELPPPSNQHLRAIPMVVLQRQSKLLRIAKGGSRPMPEDGSKFCALPRQPLCVANGSEQHKGCSCGPHMPASKGVLTGHNQNLDSSRNGNSYCCQTIRTLSTQARGHKESYVCMQGQGMYVHQGCLKATERESKRESFSSKVWQREVRPHHKQHAKLRCQSQLCANARGLRPCCCS